MTATRPGLPAHARGRALAAAAPRHHECGASGAATMACRQRSGDTTADDRRSELQLRGPRHRRKGLQGSGRQGQPPVSAGRGSGTRGTMIGRRRWRSARVGGFSLAPLDLGSNAFSGPVGSNHRRRGPQAARPLPVSRRVPLQRRKLSRHRRIGSSRCSGANAHAAEKGLGGKNRPEVNVQGHCRHCRDFQEGRSQAQGRGGQGRGFAVFTTYGLSFGLAGPAARASRTTNKTKKDVYMADREASAGLADRRLRHAVLSSCSATRRRLGRLHRDRAGDASGGRRGGASVPAAAAATAGAGGRRLHRAARCTC
jgi:hypothetical protein